MTANRRCRAYPLVRAEATATRLALLARQMPTQYLCSTNKLPAATTTRAIDHWFKQPFRLLEQNSAQAVIDLLKPTLLQLRGKALAQALGYLRQAESELGQFELAGGYFNQRQALDPLPQKLWTLAVAYLMGGDLDRAIVTYPKPQWWSGSGGTSLRGGEPSEVDLSTHRCAYAGVVEKRTPRHLRGYQDLVI